MITQDTGNMLGIGSYRVCALRSRFHGPSYGGANSWLAIIGRWVQDVFLDK